VKQAKIVRNTREEFEYIKKRESDEREKDRLDAEKKKKAYGKYRNGIMNQMDDNGVKRFKDKQEIFEEGRKMKQK